MSIDRTSARKRQSTLTWLPWLLGALVFLFYLATLNRSLPAVLDWTGILNQPPPAARITGFSHLPEFLAPVYYLATLPIRLLPPQHVPLALNFFSALCGALALTQLARSVMLLPHDRTRSQREREGNRSALLSIPTAWLPPVMATVICALSLTVWEHGTNGTAEMLDLLMFAFVVRNLLEYRIDQKESRLYVVALVYGAAMTNNLAMIAFFPLFIASLVWMRKLAFFNVRFLSRMALCGLAGLSLYLVLPIISSIKGDHSLTFWQLLSNNVMAQKWILTLVPRNTILLFSLTSIIPVVLLSIRWSSQFGDPSRVGVTITTSAFHLCHVVILLACVWMMLDPEFSPRQVAYGLSFLPIYYLAALSIGYYSGYLLLVSRPAPSKFRQPTGLARFAQQAAVVAIALVTLGTTAILLHRNFPQIRLTNGPLQKQFAAHLTENLPPNGVLISDDPYHLLLVQDRLARLGQLKNYLLLSSGLLPQPDYHKFLKKRYPDWNVPEGEERIPDNTLLALIEKIGRTQPVTYLHPSFGYYFEVFAGQPNGLCVQLIPYNTNSLVAPPLSAEVIAHNEQFWGKASEELKQKLEPAIPPATEEDWDLRFPETFYRRIGLQPQKNRLAITIGSYYSRSLVTWAVELQRAGQYEKATDYFQLAHDLNPHNIVADINLTFNKKVRSGESLSLGMDRPLDDYFGQSRSWDQLLTVYGPYDAPGLVFMQGYLYLRGNLIRQAATAFERARQQVTNDIASRLWLGQLNLNRNFPDRTIQMVDEIRQIAQRNPSVRTNINDLFTLEAAAYLAKKDDTAARQIIETNLAQDPKNFAMLASACKAYADNRRYAAALDITERMLKLQPTNTACWINRGCFLIEEPNYSEAINSFTKAINLETNNYRAILYRGIAYLRADQLDEAQADYETVQRQFPKEAIIDYGLGEIAYRRKNTNAAITHYLNYLNNAPAGTAEAKAVAERLKELKGETTKTPESPSSAQVP